MSSLASRPSAAAPWGAEFRACAELGVPLVLTNAIEMAMNLTSTVMIGHIGPDALAASTLALALYNAVLLFGLGLTAAVSPLIARDAGDSATVRRVVQGGIWNAVLITGPISALLWESEAIFRALGQDPTLSRAAADYIHVVSGLPAGDDLPRAALHAGRRRASEWAVVTGVAAVVVNAALNALLIGGAGPVPALGLNGSGLATTLANLFMAVALGMVVVLDRRFRALQLLSGPVATALEDRGRPVAPGAAHRHRHHAGDRHVRRRGRADRPLRRAGPGGSCHRAPGRGVRLHGAARHRAGRGRCG